MSSTKPKVRPLQTWIRSSMAALAGGILGYATSVALGGPFYPAFLFVFVVVPCFGVAYVVQYAPRLRDTWEARQLERDRQTARLAEHALAQLPPAARPESKPHYLS